MAKHSFGCDAAGAAAETRKSERALAESSSWGPAVSPGCLVTAALPERVSPSKEQVALGYATAKMALSPSSPSRRGEALRAHTVMS